MIKSTLNQIGNCKNEHQGSFTKILTVCSAGLLRSATLQNYLIKNYDVNVRNCGSVESFALIPISEVLIYWSDVIVFVNEENYLDVKKHLNDYSGKIIILDIPDQYPFNSPELLKEIDVQWKYILSEQQLDEDLKIIKYARHKQM
jgi:predicted protein tyrosine phosphatase